MSLQGQITDAVTRIGQEIKSLGGQPLPRNFAFAQSLGITTHTQTNFITKLSLPFTVSPGDAGVYRIDWAYSWNYDNTGTNFIAQMLLDGQIFREHHQEPKDAAGGYGSTGTDQRHLLSSFTLAQLAAGNHTFAIRFRPQSTNRNASMWDVTATAQLVAQP